MQFDKFIFDIECNHWSVYGVEVYRDGKLIESYGDTEDGIYDIYSATKSIVSIAVGIAYDRGLIDLESSILNYLPKDKVDSLVKNQRITFERLTVQRLLTMSVAGFPFRLEGDNFLDFALNVSIEHPEEKVFDYSNIPVYLVCVALQQILGEDLGDFIVENIFHPLGITKYEYDQSPEGIFYGASKVKLSVNELSRVGLLMMNQGIYEGQRIISKEYVQLATSVRQMNREGGYGYYFWKYRDGFRISGKWGQKCYCLPKQGLMVTFLANMEEGSQKLTVSMEKHILGMED